MKNTLECEYADSVKTCHHTPSARKSKARAPGHPIDTLGVVVYDSHIGIPGG